MPSSCTTFTISVRTSGSIAGMTPWPRLKTWPGWPSLRRSTSRAASQANSAPANTTVGSRLPCSDVPWPTRSRSRVERDPPVDTDDVGADRTDLGQELTGGDAEVDLRHAGVGDGVHHFLAVREDVALILRRAQGPGPGIEELNRRCAVVDLALQGADGDVGEAITEGVPQSFVGEHHRLGVCVVRDGGLR